jgi:hypothetical protein
MKSNNKFIQRLNCYPLYPDKEDRRNTNSFMITFFLFKYVLFYLIYALNN